MSNVVTLTQDPRFIARQQSRADDLYRRGVILPGHGREAAELYTRALRLDPSHALAWCNLGNCHFVEGREKTALQCYATALQHDPNQYEAIYNTGYVLTQLYQYRKAMLWLRRCLKLYPGSQDAQYWLTYVNTEIEKDKSA